MSVRRDRTAYADMGCKPVSVDGAVEIAAPVAGFYRHKLRSGSIAGGVRLFYGPPRDPVTGEELDRSWRWQAEFNGQPVDFDQVWPACAGAPITAAEYQTYIARQRWAEENAPDSAYADPRRKYNSLSASTPLDF